MQIDIQGWIKNKKAFFLRDKKKLTCIFQSLKQNKAKEFSFLKNINFKNYTINIKEISKIFSNKKKIFLIGTGGSSLGAKALLDVEYNKRITFIENIDPNYIKDKINDIPANNLGFIIISKSGETIEVLSILSILENYFSKLKFSKNSIVITENRNSTLFRFAKSRNIKILHHDPNIGGRYSCFSLTGLIPSEISGLNSRKIKKIASNSFDDYLNIQKKYNKENILSLIEFVNNKKISGHVFLCYLESFKSLMLWYRQLWAESIGKKGKGIHLMPALGSVDQHSQLQLWLEGKKDLIFTVVVPKKRENDYKILDKKSILPDYLKNNTAGEVLNKMCDATVFELNKLNIPVRVIYLEDDSLNSAVKLMATLMMEVAILCRFLDLNPFDQPAVENVKITTKKMLSKNV